jgi:hypothetical protein
MSDWQPEVRFAASWWKQRIIEAAGRAFPANSLFGVLANPLISESNLAAFELALEREIDKEWRERRVEWNRQIPLEGSRSRRVGVEGAFISNPLQNACEAVKIDELLPFIPSGCMTIINPGKVFTALDRRTAEKTYTIEPPAEPEHLKGVAGHGI